MNKSIKDMKGGDNLVAAEQRYHYDGKGSWVENPKYMQIAPPMGSDES